MSLQQNSQADFSGFLLTIRALTYESFTLALGILGGAITNQTEGLTRHNSK